MIIKKYFSIVLIFVTTGLLQLALYAQSSLLWFQNHTTSSGLSSNKVNAMLQDKNGFLWFATEDGLNRFDGYEFKVYRNNPADSLSLSDNNIWTLFEGADGDLWIGTKSGGLSRYNYNSDSFSNWIIDSSYRENGITSIFEDVDRNLWIGTYRNGLYLFDYRNGDFRNWNFDPDNTRSLSNNYITKIIQDYKGNLWISTYNGLNKFSPRISDKVFDRFYHQAGNPETINASLIWCLKHSKYFNNEIWVGTLHGLSRINVDDNVITQIPVAVENNLAFGNSISSVLEDVIDNEEILWLGSYGGLIRYNIQSGETKRYLNNENFEGSLVNNQINYVFKDHSGVLWIITEDGISKWSSKAVKFKSRFFHREGLYSLSLFNKKNISALKKSFNEVVWVGTSDGLYSFSFDFLNSKPSAPFLVFFNGKKIWSLEWGRDSNLWVGTYGWGLFRFDIKTQKAFPVEIKSTVFQSEAYKYVKSILADKQGNIWVGFWGGGLARLKENDYKIWINQKNNKYSLSHNDVWSIIEDRFGNIWIGTNGGGINLYDKDTDNFIRFSSTSGKNNLSSNTIYTICESKNPKANNKLLSTILWIGTSNGLNKITFNNSELININKTLNVNVKVFSIKNGLPDNSVKSIVEDNNGNLWIGTSNGLSKFDPIDEKFINYSSADGLYGNDFNYSTALKTNDGLILFGSSEGLNVFNPSEIKQSDYKPPVLITDFQLFNKSVSVGDGSLLKKNIIYTNKITLSHDQNIFSFQFSALDYNSPHSINYAYKMEGFDDEWIYSGSRRYAAYTNLAPGTYNFMVKSTNSDGVWNGKYTSIKLEINQPWWKTVWAYLLYFVIIILGLFAIRRFELNRTKLRNELKMRQFEAQKMKEIENVKSRFFANLSHEFRTPLMLIKGPIEQLKNGEVSSNLSDYYDLIHRNTEKLHTLIDQLLELTQLEAETIPVKARKENIVTILRGIFYSFKTFADQKNIALDFSSYDTTICAWVDRDKLEKVINNLLSNAVKFTPEGGLISFYILKNKIDENEFAEIKISDTGIGIPKEKLNQIFDRFYQVDDSSGRNYGGSGIGLSLVKELVDLHKWSIEVESEKGKGTTFILSIPLSDNYLSENQIIREYNTEIDGSNKKLSEIESLSRVKVDDGDYSSQKEANNSNPTILVVEDSSDVREYIVSLLQNDYKIIEAEDAEAGLKRAIDLMPDLILSDIMMPGTDGLEFCRQIKTNLQTSHIPLILLTAKVSQQNKIEGLETGADDYVTKPFNFKELSLRIKNLIEQRKKLKEKFSKEIKIEPEKVTANSLDKEFLEKALLVAEKNIFDLTFDLESFAKEMFLSRSQLHRKMVAITGQAPGEFLRIFRLKKAARLLHEKKLSVTQVALEVGFSSPSHFTKAFQQYFNCLPSDFTVQNNLK